MKKCILLLLYTLTAHAYGWGSWRERIADYWAGTIEPAAQKTSEYVQNIDKKYLVAGALAGVGFVGAWYWWKQQSPVIFLNNELSRINSDADFAQNRKYWYQILPQSDLITQATSTEKYYFLNGKKTKAITIKTLGCSQKYPKNLVTINALNGELQTLKIIHWNPHDNNWKLICPKFQKVT